MCMCMYVCVRRSHARDLIVLYGLELACLLCPSHITLILIYMGHVSWKPTKKSALHFLACLLYDFCERALNDLPNVGHTDTNEKRRRWILWKCNAFLMMKTWCEEESGKKRKADASKLGRCWLSFGSQPF
jgi:hypothetical protein